MATITRSDRNPPPLGDFPEESTVVPSPVPDDCFYEVIDGQIVELPPMGVYECGIASLLASAPSGRSIRPGSWAVWSSRRCSGSTARASSSAAPTWPSCPRRGGRSTGSCPGAEAWDIVPDLAVEVVSESNSANEIALKLVDYFRAGTEQVWVIYPAIRQVYLYANPTSVRILAEPGEIDGGDLIPGFRLPLSELFEDEPEGETLAAGD